MTNPCPCTTARRRECQQGAPFGYLVVADDVYSCQLFDDERRDAQLLSLLKGGERRDGRR